MEQVRFSPRRLGHLNLFVTDVEKSGAFYRDVCGFQEVFREPGISMIFLSNGNSHHDVGLMEISSEQRIGRDGHVQVKPGAGKTPGLNHLGLEMDSESALVKAFQRAKSQTVGINRTTDHQMSHSVYVTEPNGHTLEFYADMIEDWMAFYDGHRGELLSGNWNPAADSALESSRSRSRLPYHRSSNALLAARNTEFAGLPVKDLEASLRYYQDVVGLDLVHLDERAKLAVLGRGSASEGYICLVERKSSPSTRLMFGGVRLHDDVNMAKAAEALGAKSIASSFVGNGKTSCIVILDPDGVALLFAKCGAKDLFKSQASQVMEAIDRLSRQSLPSGATTQ